MGFLYWVSLLLAGSQKFVLDSLFPKGTNELDSFHHGVQAVFDAIRPSACPQHVLNTLRPKMDHFAPLAQWQIQHRCHVISSTTFPHDYFHSPYSAALVSPFVRFRRTAPPRLMCLRFYFIFAHVSSPQTPLRRAPFGSDLLYRYYYDEHVASTVHSSISIHARTPVWNDSRQTGFICRVERAACA